LIIARKVILTTNHTNARSTQCIQPPKTFAASELVSCPAFSFRFFISNKRQTHSLIYRRYTKQITITPVSIITFISFLSYKNHQHKSIKYAEAKDNDCGHTGR